MPSASVQLQQQRATLLVVCIAQFLMPFMMSAVGIALPTIGLEFGASARQLGLVETAYVAAAAMCLLGMGRLGDICGRRRIFRLGLVLFSLTGGLIALAPTIVTVIGLRFAQGVGGSMVMATTMAMVITAFPEGQRGRALGIAVAAVYAGISCGPFFGGLLVSALGWRALFWLVPLLGGLAFVVASRHLAVEAAAAAGEPLDVRGWLVYALAIGLLVVAATRLPQPWAWPLLLAGALLLGLFVVLQARTPYPLLQVALLRHNAAFALGNLAALLNYAGTFGLTFFLSLYLQLLRGYSPREAGSLLLLQPLVQALLSPLCGRWSDHWPAQRLATAGMLLCALGLWQASRIDLHTSLAGLVVLLLVLGAGFALFSSPNTRVVLSSVPARHLGMASGLAAAMRTLGMTGSMALILLLLNHHLGATVIGVAQAPAFLAAMTASLRLFAGLCLLAVLVSGSRWWRG